MLYLVSQPGRHALEKLILQGCLIVGIIKCLTRFSFQKYLGLCRAKVSWQDPHRRAGINQRRAPTTFRFTTFPALFVVSMNTAFRKSTARSISGTKTRPRFGPMMVTRQSSTYSPLALLAKNWAWMDGKQNVHRCMHTHTRAQRVSRLSPANDQKLRRQTRVERHHE